MKKLTVKSNPSYDVVIANGGLDSVCEHFGNLKAKKLFLVSDSNGAPLYLDELKNGFVKGGYTVFEKVIPAGEECKTPATYLSVIDAIAEAGLTRQDAVVSLGGGVVSDIAGFAAATYMRGIDFVTCPTTVLAAIDAAIGGKTGVDLPQGKNLLGAFHAPRLVYVATDTFKTLPECEIKNGLGEAVKYAVLRGGEILEVCSEDAFLKDPEKFVYLNAEVKADIVSRDFNEKGERKLLNLGHTFAHAAEKLSDYKLPHGVAVAKGISTAAAYAVACGKMQQDEKEKIDGLIKKCGINPEMEYTVSEMIAHIGWDKKMEASGKVSLVVPYAVGDVRYESTGLSAIAEVLS